LARLALDADGIAMALCGVAVGAGIDGRGHRRMVARRADSRAPNRTPRMVPMLAGESRSALRLEKSTDQPAQRSACLLRGPRFAWARGAYHAPVARALIDADKWLIADASCAVLAIAPWCANSPSKDVSTCIKPALLGTAAGYGVRGTAAAW